MSKLLAKAFAEAAKLPESEQDALAAWLLEEISFERQWDKTFADSAHILAQMADEALSEHRARRTRELDPKRL